MHAYFWLGVQYPLNSRGTYVCDVIKQNESELAHTIFKIQQNKAVSFFCFLLFVSILQLFVSLEPIAQSLWGFHQIKA